jgi:hypothetical protein
MRLSPLDQYYIQEAATVFSIRLCGAISLLNPDVSQQLDEGRLEALRYSQ